MPTYVYETVPLHEGDPVERFEIDQRMADSALERHPDTGVPVRRVISGGLGFVCERADRETGCRNCDG
jgi:predicted nucleic acid-binding Zn ribbon protein